MEGGTMIYRNATLADKVPMGVRHHYDINSICWFEPLWYERLWMLVDGFYRYGIWHPFGRK